MANPKSIARLEAAIRRRAAHCLQFEVADPRAEFITITGVELTRDLSIAKMHWSVLDASSRTRCEHALESASGFIQRQVGSVLSVRRTPRLQWYYDDSLAEAARIDKLIRDARQRDDEIRDGASEPNADPDVTDDPV